jgi:hypothetical protein
VTAEDGVGHRRGSRETCGVGEGPGILLHEGAEEPLFRFLSRLFGRGGVLDRLIALLQFAVDRYDARPFVAWARIVDEYLLRDGPTERTIAAARAAAGRPPRSCPGRLAALWLRKRGLLVLYRGQPRLTPGKDILSSVAAGSTPFLGETGLAASVRLTGELEALGVSPYEMRAKWHSTLVNLPGWPSHLRWQPLGGAGIPFSERLPVAAAYAKMRGEKVYVTLQRCADARRARGFGYVWEFERVALHRVARDTIIASVRGTCVPSFGPPHRGTVS